MHEIERHPAEQPFVNPRMSKGAGYDEIGVLRVEVGEQRLDGVGSPVLAQSEMCSARSLGHEMVTPVAFLDGIRKSAQRHTL